MARSSHNRSSALACPFFMPQHRYENGPWPHPLRLPLGGGWHGHCTAPGHEGEFPELTVLEDGCNLGYAKYCSRRPGNSAWDSVRFQVTRSGDRRISITYVCERDHRPSEHGSLEYERVSGSWTPLLPHPDIRVQKMSECFLDSYLLRGNSKVETLR